MKLAAMVALCAFVSVPLRGQPERQPLRIEKLPDAKTTKTQGDQKGTKQSPIFVHVLQDPQSETDAAKTEKDNKRKELNDLIIAWSAGLAALFTGLLVVVGWRGVYAAIRTLKAIERQTESTLLNTKAFIHSQRPWLSVEVGLRSPLLYDEQGAHITLEITLNNVGQIPATGVWINPMIYVKSPAKPHPVEERKRICDDIIKADDIIKPKSNIGQVVFPGHTTVQRYTVSAPASEIEACCRAIFGDEAASARMFSLSVIVAVAYRTVIDEEACCYTAVIYDLSRSEIRAPNAPFALKIGETVPLESLQLFMLPFAGIVAE